MLSVMPDPTDSEIEGRLRAMPPDVFVRLGRAMNNVRRADPATLTTWTPSRVLEDGAHTFPYLEVKNTSSQVEHEASTSKIGEDQIFYCRQRGISTEDAVSMIVHGFCKEVFRELPMEFAVEAQKLLGVSLEGSVG